MKGGEKRKITQVKNLLEKANENTKIYNGIQPQEMDNL
jgi:hypothetical protein